MSSVESKSPERKYSCIHQKNKYTCKECRGSGLCDHGRVKSQCKDCGGSGFCEHGRVKSQCKDCGVNPKCRLRVECVGGNDDSVKHYIEDFL